MTLDDFFKGSKEAWEKAQRQIADEAKAREEEERRQKIEVLKAGRAGGKKTTIIPPAAPAVPSIVIPTGNFQIESLADRYRLHNVQYNNGVYVVDWSKELLENGATKKQQEWIAATQSTEWKIPDMQLYHATFATLYRHKDHAAKEQQKLVKELQQVFKTDFAPDKSYMTTSTRIQYAASRLDKVTHNFGYPFAQEHSLVLVGRDACVAPSSGLEAQMEVLLGSRDLAEIKTVYKWISGKNPYLWRLEQAPAQDEEQAVVLGCYSYRFNIYCDGGSDISWPSRGVVASARKK